jgi:hypothetical protein
MRRLSLLFVCTHGKGTIVDDHHGKGTKCVQSTHPYKSETKVKEVTRTKSCGHAC